MSYDILNNSTFTQSIKPQSVTTLVEGTGVDVGFAAQVVARFSSGTWSSGTTKLILQDSDDDSTYANVETADVFAASDATAITVAASGIVVTIDAAAEDDKTYSVGYCGGKKYLRACAISESAIILECSIEAAYNRYEGNSIVS